MTPRIYPSFANGLRWVATAWLAICLLAAALVPAQAAGDSLILVLTADGTVTPALSSYLQRGIRTAEQRGAEMLIFQLNTPGGSISVMNEMVQAIRQSSVPVVVYVAPRGAMAASAGTILTLAGHAAAMAPETIIGAASPVSGEGQDLDETMQAKEKNALIATIEALMTDRPPEAVELAKQTVETAKAISASQALEIGMVDFIATDLEDLLRQLDGHPVKVLDTAMTLDTQEARMENLPISLIEQILLMLTDPNVVFLLISVGAQALLIELSSPGGWVAGFIGIVALALAFYGLGVLPVNWFGLLFLILAFALFLLEVKAPTHGALTIAGVGSLIAGGLVLFNSPGTPEFQRVSVPLVIGVSLATAASFLVIVSFAIRALRVPISMGQESIVGKTGLAHTALNPTGQVQVASELWSAELADGEAPIEKNERVQVVRAEGLRLIVKKEQH
ncbi:MAG: nodulation protein NfeD [Anaerolineales bacterium]|jgi:membrane-bound serine protease (ClpP class)|nr:nodulation protein NfeD [Anaerolineales bacterium]